MNLKIKKVTAEGYITENTLVKVILDSNNMVIINKNNIATFIEHAKSVFTEAPFEIPLSNRNVEEIQGVANLLTIKYCMKYNNLLETDVSEFIEELTHKVIKKLLRKGRNGKYKVNDIIQLIASTENEVEKEITTHYDEWKAEDDNLGKMIFEKMMGDI